MALSVNGGNPLSWEADIQMGTFMQKLNEIEKGIHGVSQASEKEIKSIESLVQKATAGIAAYASFAGASSFISDVIRVRSEFEMLSTSFKVMLGNKAEADRLMAEVTEFAAVTPFTLQDLSAATKSLLAFGVQAKDIKGTLQALGDVSAGIGAPIKEIADIYGKAKVQGRLFAEDINQLTGRGIPIIQELAKQFGVTEDKVKGLVESGKVGFPQIEQAFKSMTASGSQFGGMMSAMAGTVGGAISNLQDSWSRLLNTIGEQNEGTIKGAIDSLSFLIEHYEDVLDVLKVIIATYGAYRAAIIANTVAVKVYDVATKRLAITQTLQATATTIAAKAQVLLNTAMKANPALLFAGAVGALVAALLIFNRRAAEASKSAQILADSQEKAAKGMAEVQGKIQPYVDALKNANLSEQQRVNIYNKLKEINPDIVKGLDAQTLSYEKLKGNVDLYLESLRTKLTLEANEAAVVTSINEENALNKRLEKARQDYLKLDTSIKEIKKAGGVAAQAIDGLIQERNEAAAEMRTVKGLIQEQKKLQADLGKAIVGKDKPTPGDKSLKDFLADSANLLTQYQEYIKLVKNKEDAELVKKALIEKMESFAPGDQAKEAYKKRINEVNKLLEQYKVEAPKNAAKTQAALDKKENVLLEARKDLLQSIADIRAQAEADTQGKQISELEKINQKYEGLIRKVGEFNEKVTAWNKDPRNKNNQVPLVGGDVTRQIREAQALEVSQELMEQDVKNYEKSLKEKSDLFKQYQATVQEVGKKDADKLYEGEKLAFDSYLDYLKSEIGKIGTKISLGVDLNLADEGKLKLLTQELKNVTKEQADQQIADTKRVMVATLNAAEQRKVIEANYLKEVEILRKTYTGKELEERERVLKEALNADLINLAGALAQQTDLYRKMNADIYKLANNRINNEIKLLEKQLKEIENKDPGLAKAIRKAIEEWKKLQQQMNGTEDKVEAIGEGAGKLSGAFSDLAGSVGGLNEGLGEALSMIGDLVGGVGKAANSFKAFKDGVALGGVEGTLGAISGGIGMISAAFSVISTIDGIVSRAQDKKIQAYRAEKQRQVDIITGEIEINELYRERAREQVLINKLRLEGIEAEMRLLEEQKKVNESEVARVMEALSKEYKVGYNSLLDNTVLTNGQTYKEAMSLAGKTFEELEKLAAMNLLNDRSQQLFDTLKKLKEEGVDIEQARLAAIEREKETLTATNADSIADSIIEGFKKGYRSAKDFAEGFGDMMQAAVLNALKYNALEAPLKAFYEQFALDAKSGGALTKDEIANLQQIYNAMITDAARQFEELQKVTGVSFKGGGSSANSLQGAIKGMTEEQAELLAGQFGGLRLSTLELVKIGQQNLTIQNRIQNNTGISAQKLTELMDKLNRITNGAEKLNVKL